MTLIAWAAYRYDKQRATEGWSRVSERTLLALALAGGVLGAILGVYGHHDRHTGYRSMDRGGRPHVLVKAASIMGQRDPSSLTHPYGPGGPPDLGV